MGYTGGDNEKDAMTKGESGYSAALGTLQVPEMMGFKPLRRGIGLRLFVLILLFSSLVTLVSTMVQLYVNYRSDVAAIERRLDEIEGSSLGSIAASLWHVDADQLRLQLEGLRRLPDMQAVEVRETQPTQKPLMVSVGQSQPTMTIVRQVPVVYSDRGIPRSIGILRIEATLTGVYGRLIDMAVVILITQGVKTFLVSLFILYIVHRLVTRHLIAIARYVDGTELGRAGTRLQLERRPPDPADELDQVVAAVNASREAIEAAYEDLREANVALENDIADRRHVEADLRVALERLQRSNEELERFAYVASHDLQEPLRGLILYSQLLERRYGSRLEGDGAAYLDFTVRAARRMHSLINDLLAYSRLMGGQQPLAPIDAEQACAAALDSLRPAITEAGATVTVAPLPVVLSDESQLTLLFEHLIGNAVKFRAPGVTPLVTVTAQRRNGQWEFAVADNGIGIEASEQDIFQLFRRLHTQDAYPGTGVGLAICKRIVERHGGRLWVASQPGQGSTFFFTLMDG